MDHGAQIVAPAGVPVVPEHELLRPIASGAYGQVWLARNALGAYRAVKVVHRGSFDHDRPFEREFAGIKAFEPISRSHEGLVNLLQVGRDDAAGNFYYVMELADDARAQRSNGDLECSSDEKAPAIGPTSTTSEQSTPLLQHLDAYVPRTLAAELKPRGRLPLEECVQIGLALTRALAYLHSQGLVHRDIKPSNIIFVHGVPKLADVGLVTLAAEARSFVGTEGFIAPEGPGTPQADLYSLGIVLYVISTGKSHQDFPEPLADLAAQRDHIQRLEFDAIVYKACQTKLNERYQTAQQMHDELLVMQQGRSVKRTRAAHQRWAVGRKLGLAAVALALLVPALRSRTYHHTPTLEAQIAYENGLWFYNKLTPEDHKKALAYLNQAIELDPKYVQPYGQLTAMYVWGVGAASQREEQRRKTREIAQKVFAIDPNLAEGHTALSWSKFLEWDWQAAEDEIVRAIQLNPRYPIARDIYCFYLTMRGRTDEAHRQIERSEELDPTARTTSMVASWPFIAERKFNSAIAQLHRVVELDKNFGEAHEMLGRCYEAQRNYPAAIQEFKSGDLLKGADPAKATADYAALQQAYDTAGEAGYFRKWIDLIRADSSLPEEQQLFSEQDLAGCYAQLGEKEKALDELEKNLTQIKYWELKFEPLYDNLHDEPRFKALLKRARLEK
jgi:serine/threonine protein kinase